jgi:hypothetical protein
MVSQRSWSEYDTWNDAIAQVIFPSLLRPNPVYIDLEDDQLAAIGSLLDISPADVEQTLTRVVRDTVDGSLGRGMFRPHLRRLQRWRQNGDMSAPPTLALLAVFSLAAEHMARGDGLRENNFYGRLQETLALASSQAALIEGYRIVAEPMWGAVNRWLLDLNGTRGLPTAFTLSHRYVGLALSQALVRHADRQRLLGFFRKFDLAPGSDFPPGELEPLLDAWITQTPSPATRNLERLWAKESIRERVAQAAAVALANWDGAIEDEEIAAKSGKILLTLELATFPARRLKVRALLYAPRAEGARTAIIHTPDGDVEVPLEPGAAGALDLGTGTTLDPTSTFEGVLRVTDRLTGSQLEHRPRRMLAFRRDQLSNRLIETGQVMLGDDHVLVVHSQLIARVRTVLAKIARPGWSCTTDGLPGLPAGWAVLQGVEVFASPGDLVRGIDDLSALIPITRTQLRAGGGLPLPGATRNKWHTWDPPEVRAVSEIPGFSVALLAFSEEDLEAPPLELHRWFDEGAGVLVGSIDELELRDGDYRIELWPDGAKDAASALSMRLRTADTPDSAQWAVASSVTYSLDDPLAVLGAGSSLGGAIVRGAVTTGSRGALANAEVPDSTWWASRHLRSAEVGGIRSVPADPDSCVMTGRHHELVEQVPTDRLGRPLVKTSSSRCAGCGLTRKYPTSYYANRRKHARRLEVRPGTEPDVAGLPVVDPDAAAQWDLVLDGLMHTGGGRWSQFERLAMSIEPSALFVDYFARALEALGHIDVRRDALTLEPVEWEVTPTTATETAVGWVLTGYWSERLQQEFAVDVGRPAGALQTPQTDGPSRWRVDADGEAVELAARGLDIATVTEAWRDLAGALPSLSQVVAALPRRSVAEGGPIRWFDPQVTAWVQSADAKAPGAYRLGKYGAHDILRTRADIETGQMAASQVYLSKHAAVHMLTGRLLMAHNRATDELRVPLGADLPGLYARAAVMPSGLLPTKSGHDLVYHQVPRSLAQHLAHLLSN